MRSLIFTSYFLSLLSLCLAVPTLLERQNPIVSQNYTVMREILQKSAVTPVLGQAYMFKGTYRTNVISTALGTEHQIFIVGSFVDNRKATPRIDTERDLDFFGWTYELGLEDAQGKRITTTPTADNGKPTAPDICIFSANQMFQRPQPPRFPNENFRDVSITYKYVGTTQKNRQEFYKQSELFFSM